MQGRPAVRVGGVHIRATLDEQLDGLRPTGDRRPEQRRPAVLGVQGFHRHPARQVPLDGAKVTRSRSRPDIRRTLGRGRAAGLPGGGRTSRGWRLRS